MNKENGSLPKSLQRLMFGQCISIVGDMFTNLSITWFIVSYTGSALQMGVNLALNFIPSLILSPFLGGIVDRVSRKKILWVSDLIRFALDLILIYMISVGMFSIYIIYLYTTLKTTMRLLCVPSQRAIIQQLTEEGQRLKANALQQLSQNSAFVIGPLLAGYAVKYLPMQLVISFDALTFLLSALIILTVKINEKHIVANSKPPYFKQMAEGFSFIGKHRWIILLSFSAAFVNGGNALAFVARPFMAKDILGLQADAFGVLISVAGVGAVLTSLILIKIKLKKDKLKLVTYSILVWGVGVACVSLSTNLITFALFMFITCSMGPIMGANTNAFYQNEIPPDLMGRVAAVRTFIATLSMPVGSLFGAKVINMFGIRCTFIFAGLTVLIASVFTTLASLQYKKSKIISAKIESHDINL